MLVTCEAVPFSTLKIKKTTSDDGKSITYSIVQTTPTELTDYKISASSETEKKNIDGYIEGNICVLPFRVDENTYLKITKASPADGDTFYLKGNSLIRVNKDESFYVYSMTADTDKTKAYSEWTVDKNADRTKSGSCADKTGIFTACTGDKCVGNTISTLKITKTKNADTYTLTPAEGDLKDYDKIEDITKTDDKTKVDRLLGNSPCGTDKTVGEEYLTFKNSGEGTDTYYLTKEKLIIEKSNGFFIYKAEKTQEIDANKVITSIWSITTAADTAMSGSCDSTGKFTACTAKKTGRMLLDCSATTLKTIKIKKETTTSDKDAKVTYSFVDTIPTELKDYLISASSETVKANRLLSNSPCGTDQKVGDNEFLKFKKASAGTETFYLTKEKLIIEKDNNAGFFIYKAVKSQVMEGGTIISSWSITADDADTKISGSCDSTGKFTACTAKKRGRMLLECEGVPFSTLKIKKVTDAEGQTTYTIVVPSGYENPTIFTEDDTKTVDRLLGNSPCGTDKTVGEEYLTFKNSGEGTDTYYLTKEKLIIEKSNGFFIYKAVKTAETIDGEIISKWEIETTVDKDKKSGSCDSTTFTECTVPNKGRMLLDCETNTITTLKIKKTTADGETTYTIIDVNGYSNPTKSNEADKTKIAQLLSDTPCGTPTDDKTVNNEVYLKLKKDNKISYIHGLTYIVVKDENTTEVYTITKEDAASKQGSKFTFSVPTGTDADKGGKCVNGEYEPCKATGDNKCSTAAPTSITIIKNGEEYTCDGYTITIDTDGSEFNKYTGKHEFCAIKVEKVYVKIEDSDIIKQTKDLINGKTLFITKDLIYYHTEKFQFAFKVKKVDSGNYSTYSYTGEENKIEIDTSSTGYIPDKDGNFDKAVTYGCSTYKKFASINWIIKNCDVKKTSNITKEIIAEHDDFIEELSLPQAFTKSVDEVYYYKISINTVGERFGNITQTDEDKKLEDISSTIIPSLMMLFIIILIF